MRRLAWPGALPLLAVMLPAVASAEAVTLGRAPAPPAPTARSPIRIKHPPRFPPPSFRNRQTTAVLVETSTHEVAVDRLPAASLLPPPLPGAPAPPPPAPDARRDSTALRLVDASPKTTVARAPGPVVMHGELADPWSGPRGSVGSSSPVVRIEVVGDGVAALGWEQGSSSLQPTLSARCDAPRAGAKPAALRPVEWRQLQLRPDGTFALREGTAWFDRTGCKLVEGATHESPLKVVAAIEGRPVALAALSGSEIVLVTPSLGDVQQDGGNAKAHSFLTEAGAVMVTRVKPVRGGSLSLSGSLAPFVWQQWRTKLGDTGAAIASLPATVLRFDVSQAVSEPAPLALLTVQRPVGTREETAPPVLGAAPASTRGNLFGGIADPF